MASRAAARPADAAADTIRDAARATEQDRALAALLAPRAVRSDLVTLAAFLGDLARIPRVVSDPRLGAIRLQWWVDTIEGFDAGAPPSGHLLADALHSMVLRRGLATAGLAAVVEARFADVDDTPVADEAAFARTLAGTEGGGFRLAARVLGVPVSDAAESALDAAGVAYGMTRVLAALPRHDDRRLSRLPASWPEVSAVAATAPASPARAEASRALVARGARLARAKLRVVHDFSARSSHSFNAAVLPCALVEPYLQALERSRVEPADTSREVGPLILPLTRVWRLWRAHRRGHI